LLQFAQRSREARNELLNGAALRSCREVLQGHGLPLTMPTGALVFCAPSQYRAAQRLMVGRDLRRRHVLVRLLSSTSRARDGQLADAHATSLVHFRQPWSLLLLVVLLECYHGNWIGSGAIDTHCAQSSWQTPTPRISPSTARFFDSLYRSDTYVALRM